MSLVHINSVFNATVATASIVANQTIAIDIDGK